MEKISETTVGKGHCLCGKVKVTANTMAKTVGTCHCNACRRWAGGPSMAVDCGSDVVFEGEENIKIFESSPWAERGFCSNCGNHLFYRLKQNNKYMMPAGLFDGDVDFIFTHQVFIDEKPSYYCFSNKTHNMTGQQIFEIFSPK